MGAGKDCSADVGAVVLLVLLVRALLLLPLPLELCVLRTLAGCVG